MREIAWEEALRAWRIVQPTLFRRIYKTPQEDRLARFLERTLVLSWVNSVRPDLYRFTIETQRMIKDFTKKENSSEADDYPWFLPRVLADGGSKGAKYYAGSYLEQMLSVLLLAQYLLLLPLVVRIQQGWAAGNLPLNEISIAVGLGLLIFLRDVRVRRRRTMLEDELLSVHSCAIIWQTVVVAHYQALSTEAARPYHHYTEQLAKVAIEIADSAFHLPSWLTRQRGGTT